jgi:hypothetical protein
MPYRSNGQTFRLGLTMAGAISAGAYTGGVVDFLIQALDEWESAKADPAVPQHKVEIPVMSDASAGAITSAVAAVALNSETTPVVDVDKPPPENAKRLYDAWVRQIDLSKLLRSDDIADGRPVVSLLDSTVLDSIARDALKAPKRAAARAYVADPLAVFLTVSNLRGVPHGFKLFGGDQDFVYGMLRPMDNMRFAVSRTGRQLPYARTLDPAQAPHANWPELAAAALASSAFPVGLRSRALNRPYADYKGRLVVESGEQSITIDPLWRDRVDPFAFLNVDGGLISNEPLELARQYAVSGRRSGQAQSARRREGRPCRRHDRPLPEYPCSRSQGRYRRTRRQGRRDDVRGADEPGSLPAGRAGDGRAGRRLQPVCHHAEPSQFAGQQRRASHGLRHPGRLRRLSQ